MLGVVPSGGMCLIAILAGMFPDADFIILLIEKKNLDLGGNAQHHLHSPLHWPVVYTPLAVVVILSGIGHFIFPYILAIGLGILSHFLLDMIASGDGINWAMPWGKTFVNFFCSATDGYHGNYWSARYRHTTAFKFEVASVLLSIILVFLFFMQGHSTSVESTVLYWGSIAVIAGAAASGWKRPKEKYNQEPPGGRYNDYRRIPEFYMKLSKKKKDALESWQTSHPDLSLES